MVPFVVPSYGIDTAIINDIEEITRQRAVAFLRPYLLLFKIKI